jgi:glycerol-3-phosphate acyltransferase PlsY
LGTWAFLVVLLCDLSKGVLAVWLTRRFTHNETLALLAMLAVTIGHIWPAPLRFRGGKGVATSLGALLFFDWRIALTFCALAGIALLVVRRFTLAGLVAFAALPLVAMAWRHAPVDVFGILILTVLVLFTHRKNIDEEIVSLAARRTQPKPETKT